MSCERLTVRPYQKGQMSVISKGANSTGGLQPKGNARVKQRYIPV